MSHSPSAITATIRRRERRGTQVPQGVDDLACAALKLICALLFGAAALCQPS
jgi:hypothetical protein